MSSYFGQFLDQLSTGDNLRDWQHASKLFVDSLYRLGPKYNNLFHIWVDLDSTVTPQLPDGSRLQELGMLAKTVTLPKFTVQTKTYNAYNRKNIAQERINYDPVNITFHDDSANIVRDFWYGYYKYYYRDTDESNTEQLYGVPFKYTELTSQNWGYTPMESKAVNYIKAIRIYSLHQKKYSAYYLIRPTITSFSHGQHQNGETGLLENSMQVAYESVIYDSGIVADGKMQASGFGQMHYDPGPSPLTSAGGATASILGPAGLYENAGAFLDNIKSGNYLGAALGAARTAKTFKNKDLKEIAAAEISELGMNILRGKNPASPIFVPTTQSIKSGISAAVNSRPNPTSSSSPFPGIK